jgi:hypothetical protein
MLCRSVPLTDLCAAVPLTEICAAVPLTEICAAVPLTVSQQCSVLANPIAFVLFTF